MEHYKGIILSEEKKKNIKTIIVVIIFALVVLGIIAAKYTAQGKIFSQKIFSIAAVSFNDALGISPSGNSQEISLGDLSGGISVPQIPIVQKGAKKKTSSSTKKKTEAAASSSAIIFNKEKNNILAIESKASSSVATSSVPIGIISAPASHTWQSQMQVTYSVSVSLGGDGRGIVTSTLPGINCGQTCVWNFPAGQTITLHETADTASSFGGWSGACSGFSKDCQIVVSGYVSVGVLFHRLDVGMPMPTPISQPASSAVPSPLSGSGAPIVASSDAPSSSFSLSSSSYPSSSSDAFPSPLPAPSNHILIAALQIAGQSSSNDWIEIINPTASEVDMAGWKLHKHSSTGNDYSLKEFPKGTTIPSQGELLWANSSDGFAQSIGADFSTSETLSPDNSVALLDASGTVVDAVAWGMGTSQYGEGDPYPASPGPNQILGRLMDDGVFVDTNNNASDFSIQ
jgi:hypothetical protein